MLEQKGANLKNVNKNVPESDTDQRNNDDSVNVEQKKQEPNKKPTTGVVGSDDGSNVIVF